MGGGFHKIAYKKSLHTKSKPEGNHAQHRERTMITRRTFLRLSVTGAGLFLLTKFGSTRAFAAIPGGTLDPAAISKYQMPLIIPPAMPRTGKIKVKRGKNVDYYEIAVRQFQQQILPPGMPPTTVWSYGSANHPD